MSIGAAASLPGRAGSEAARRDPPADLLRAALYTAANGVDWTTTGGDYDASTVVATRSVPAGEPEVWHDFDITSAMQAWVNGDKPNLGLLLRVADESRTVKNDIDYTASDAVDSLNDVAHHPKLAVTYADGSHAVAPTVSIGSRPPMPRCAAPRR